MIASAGQYVMTICVILLEPYVWIATGSDAVLGIVWKIIMAPASTNLNPNGIITAAVIVATDRIVITAQLRLWF